MEVVKKTANKVTIKLKSANRIMRIDKTDFEKRVKEGMYEIVPSKKTRLTW